MTEKETYIEPYNFSKQTLKVLIEFVNKYLILFGYASSIEEQKRKGGDFTRRLIIFEKNNLGI
jgi:hypothetical protein